MKWKIQSAEADRVDQHSVLHISPEGAQGGQAIRAVRARNRPNGKQPQAPMAQRSSPSQSPECPVVFAWLIALEPFQGTQHDSSEGNRQSQKAFQK